MSVIGVDAKDKPDTYQQPISQMAQDKINIAVLTAESSTTIAAFYAASELDGWL
jgi:hypothetical protein